MKKLFNFINVSKVYAVVTAICFLISTLGANIQASINKASPTTDIYSHIFDNLNAIKQEYGKITSVRDLSSDVTVINIQDLHCHLQTQKNISELINEIDKNYLLKSVFIEGGYGNIETTWINQIKDKDFQNKVIEQLIQDGYLTGAEYYAIKNKKENILKGIDEEKIHLNNLSRLAKIMEKESLYNDVIFKVNKEISILNNYYINEQNKRFTRSFERYKKGKIDSIKFYKILFKYAEKINNNLEKYNNIIPINTEYYPNINTYINISKQSTEINTRLVGLQLQQLIIILKNEMSYNSYKKLLTVTNNFNDTEKLVDFLTNFCKERNFDISKNFNELDKFIKIKNSNKKFNPVELLNEERILIDQIRMALSYDNTEYEIAYITDFQEYFKNYLKYSLNAQDWQYFKQGFEKFKYLYSKYAVVDRIKPIENDFSEIDKYYDTNSDRNNVFIANILNSINRKLETKQSQQRTSEEILKQSKDIIIVITGGYHSLDLQNILSTKNINSIVITPNITDNVSQANKKYEDIIKAQNKLLSQALAFKLASSSSNIEQKTLLTKVAVELLGKNNLSQLNDLLNAKINIYKDDKGNTIVNYIDDKIEIKLNQQINKSLQLKQDNVKNILNISIQQISNIIPTDGLKSIFTPDIYQIMKEISLQLFNLDIYFSNGPVFEIVNSQYNNEDIDGISPEIYSTFLPEIQKMLLEQQNDKVTDNIDIPFRKKIDNAKAKSKPRINEYLSYDNLDENSEEAISPSYVDDNILIPTIDNLLKCILYKNSFDLITKLLVFLINIFEEEKHYPYFDILKNSKDKIELKSIASNTNIELKYRLFALMYLKKNGFYINDSITSDIRERFIIDIKDGRFKVKNNFDLRALTTGVFLSLDYFTNDLIKNKEKQIIYGRISKALIVKKGKKRTTANAAMFFVAYDPLTIAHELGHNILFDLGFHTSNGTELTIHELFADVVANIFGNIISDYKIDQNAVLYDLFNESFDYNYVFQEEHSAARGFINLLLNTSYSINEYMRWEKLANIIINYVSKKKKMKEKQAEVFHDISQQYFNSIINSQIYPKTNMAEIEKILLTESCYTVVNDILLEVKEISQKRYSIIIDTIKQNIVMPKSYRYAKKSKLDYDNDSVIINNIILSQPRKIYDVLKIIKSEILKKFYFNKSEMEILVSIDILLKSDINDTSRNTFITQLKKYLRYIPDKKACDMDDYRRLENYINGYEYPVLTMTWLNKLLLSMGKIDFNERQQIITAVEYPIIVLGMFFPKIRDWFIKKHENAVVTDEKLKDLEKVTEKGVIKVIGNSVEEIKNSSLINKLIVISKIVADKTIKRMNVEYHTKLNIESNNLDNHIFIQFVPYQVNDLLDIQYNNERQNTVSVYIANDIEQLKMQYKLINTDLTIDGQNIWQININGNLVYAASGVDTLKIIKTVNNSRLIKNDLKKILNLKNNINLNIDSSVFVDTATDGIYFDDGIIITNTNFYIKSITEIFKSISMMYAQKTIISLDNIQNEKLYQALSNGTVRKTITIRQFEYLKDLFKQENKDIVQEILQLRKKGIEIYIKSEGINNIYANYGISGQIIGNTIYDYYLNETIELEVIESKMTIKDLENKMINSEKPLLIGIDILQEIFRANRDITDAYNGFSSLLGNIKIKFGLQNINVKDMANFAYSIDITNIPIINETIKNKIMDANINDFNNLVNLDKNNVISIILNDTKISNDMKNIFLTVIKERILVRTKLLEQNKENGLKDKKLEILLGKVLLLQLANTDKNSLLSELDTFKGNEQDMIVKVNELYQKALTNNEPQVINTIIELILVYSEEYKTKGRMKVNNIDIIAYRQMLAAA